MPPSSFGYRVYNYIGYPYNMGNQCDRGIYKYIRLVEKLYTAAVGHCVHGYYILYGKIEYWIKT